MTFFTHDRDREGVFVGRIWSPDVAGPSVVTVRDRIVLDITSSAAPTVSDLCEQADPAGYIRAASGTPVGPLAEIAANPPGDLARHHFLAP